MTTARPRFLLDSTGDAQEVVGYSSIRTESDFLRHALMPAPLLVRGNTLCRWAEDFCAGRGLAWERALSPTASLQMACHALTQDQAEQILAVLNAHGRELPRQPQIAEILETLYSDGPWQEMPGRQHTARWLLWLEQEGPIPALQPLLVQTAQQWQERALESEQRCYAAHDADTAREMLQQWMGIKASGGVTWDPFPLPVPARWQEQARQIWSDEGLATRADLFDDVRQRKAPDALMGVAAELSLTYYRHHPGSLTSDKIRRLGVYLSHEDASRLQGLLPPDDPGPLPDTAPAVLKWFTSGYLPFRQWEVAHGGEAARARSEHLAREFASWCLGFYPAAISGGAGQPHLAINQAKQLRQGRTGRVTLWVVFDGLTYADGQHLAERLSQEARLSEEQTLAVFSSLPTITSFCKRSLLNGVPPALVTEETPVATWSGARMLERNKDPQAELASSAEGDVFIWSLTEPDQTYHARFDAPTVRRNVQSQLDNWARRIVDAALAVPDALPLRVILSTDHGRLLTSGERRLSVPANMEAHGRAAYGDAGKVFDASGIFVDGPLVYLDRDRFRLPVDCAVAFGSDVFETSDGKSGRELFPHGGLYPEEVLIPWIEFVRDRKHPTVRCTLSGRGRAGASGLLKCRFENLGSILVTAVAVRLHFGDNDVRRLPLSFILQPMGEAEQEVAFVNWPTNLQIKQATGTVEYQTATGAQFEGGATLEMQSTEMQRRDISLEDL